MPKGITYVLIVSIESVLVLEMKKKNIFSFLIAAKTWIQMYSTHEWKADFYAKPFINTIVYQFYKSI